MIETRGRALAIAALFVTACATAPRDDVRVLPAGVRFQLRRPDATAVVVAGDFNGWSPTSHPMARAGDVWIRTIALPPGEHLFMYVVDGEWLTPPNAPEVVPDGFGSTNGKVVVP